MGKTLWTLHVVVDTTNKTFRTIDTYLALISLYINLLSGALLKLIILNEIFNHNEHYKFDILNS